MHRYNIDTKNGDLIQIDLSNGWSVTNDHEEIRFTVINFNTPINDDAGPYFKESSIIVCKKDLSNLLSHLKKILPS